MPESRITSVKIIHGDARRVLARMKPKSIGSIVTDPPYGLGFMGNDWDRLTVPKPIHCISSADRKMPSVVSGREHLSAMQAWHLTWTRAAIRVLKPGGYLLAMGSPRTYHRLACALDNAGFEIRDCLCWIYATGFPKSTDLARSVAKETGEYMIEGSEILQDIRRGRMHPGTGPRATYERQRILPSGTAARWAGWGTALKPAWEPILVARKPLGKRNLARNILAFGTGGLNVDGCRIPYQSESVKSNNWYRKDKYASARGSLFQSKQHPVRRSPASGRFPANAICDNLPVCGPLPGIVLEEKGVSGTASRGVPIFRKTPKTRNVYGQYRMRGTDYPAKPPETDLGNGILGPYTRFFRLPVEERGAPRFFVVPKPSKQEKGAGNPHPTVKPVRLFRHLIRLVTPPGETVCDPFLGSGTSAVAAVREGVSFIGIEKEEEYVRIAAKRVRRVDGE